MADTVCDYLRKRIKIFLADKDESIRWFSKQCGVDYSTVYRVQSGEQQRLSFRNAAKILKAIEPSAYLTILADYYPFETKELAKTEQDKVDDFALALAADINLYRVHMFATEKNATRDQVKEKYGSDGLEKIETLLEKGVLSEVGGQFYDNLKGMTYPSEDVVKRVSIHHFWMVPLDSPGSILENFRGTVDIEGLKDLHQLSVTYRGQVHQILDQKKGDIIVAGSLIAGPTE